MWYKLGNLHMREDSNALKKGHPFGNGIQHRLIPLTDQLKTKKK